MTPRRTARPQRSTAGATRNANAVIGLRAFTLIELLIVIGIIAVLISMALVVGSKVIEGGKGRATQNVIRVLDESRGAWMLNADVPLPAMLEVPQTTGNNARVRMYPIIDARQDRVKDFEAPVALPSIRLYTALVQQDESIRASLEQLDSAFVKPKAVPMKPDGSAESWSISGLDILDAWGRPLRFVHPAYHGGHGDYWNPDANRLETDRPVLEIDVPTGRGDSTFTLKFRRSYRPFADDDKREGNWIGDADEGMCIGGSAYFYSAGEDGDPGTRRNNVYSTVPRFPIETRDFE